MITNKSCRNLKSIFIYLFTEKFIKQTEYISDQAQYFQQFPIRQENRSTDDALLSVTISRVIIMIRCGSFLDIAKAFVTENHNILLQKLDLNGIRGLVLKLLNSKLLNLVMENKIFVLVDMSQFVVPKGTVLNMLKPKWGVLTNGPWVGGNLPSGTTNFSGKAIWALSLFC